MKFMSDYLWDKSGEPEEDVERLEQLLGTLRYEPRPFVVPEDFSARPARSTFRPPQRPFAWRRLALAASLLLTLLVGAWLLTAQHNERVQRESARQQQQQQPVAPTTEPAPQNQTANAGDAHEQPAPRSTQTTIGERVNYRPAQRVFNRARANETRRARQELIKGRSQEQLATVVMTPEQKAATEQLLLALRIASAKYNYAQREVQEASAVHKPETR